MKKISIILIITFSSTFIAYPQTTRYWVGGGEAYGNDGTKWSYTSGGSPIGGTITWQTNDIARFDLNSGTGIVVIINAIGTIGKLQISGNRTVTLRPDNVDDRVLNINTAASDAFTLAAGSTLIITGLDATTDRYLRLNMNSYTTANIYGYLKVTESGTGYGEFSKSSSGIINFHSGSTYEHNTKETGSDLPVATWNTGSTCLITGITSSLPGNYSQSFYHFTWNCGSQSNDIDFNGNLTTINGNFSVANTNNYILSLSATAFVTTTIQGNYIQSGGKFAMVRYSADNILNIDGNFTLSGGYFYMSISDGAHTTVNLKGNMSLSSGAYFYTASGSTAYTNFKFTGSGNQTFTNGGVILYYKIHFTVVSPAVLDLGGYVLGHYQYSTGDFTLQSGAGIKTSHTSGMTATGNTNGCIQLMGTRTYNSGGHYTFYANGAQSTGNGLQSPISGSVTIGSTANSTNLTFSNATTINGSLILIKGTVASSNISYGSSALLEYRGNASQTMGNNEWPSSTVANLKINNSSGVTMNVSKTINTNLNLFSGTLSIEANNTLTLNNSSITVNSGTLTGGTLTNIIFSGSGNTTLPAVINGLNNLTINRSGSTITIGGAVTVYGIMFMTAGNCTLSTGNISYGTSGILRYNGTSTQTTSSAEFPSSDGPASLVIENATQVNLHANRQINQTLFLTAGTFNLSAYTLTMAGDVQRTTGQLASGTNGHLLYIENTQSTILPPTTTAGVYNITVNRSGGVTMAGDVTINNSLALTNGDLGIGSNLLTLNGTITVNTGTLTGGENSSIYFGGTGSSTGLPGITLKNLTLNRANGIYLLDDATIHNQLTLTNGRLDIASFTLFINGTISSTSSGSLGGVNSTVQINDSPLLLSTDFPTADLKTILVYRPQGVTMTGNVSVYDDLVIHSGNFSIGNSTLTLYNTYTQNGGLLTSGINSNLTVAGTSDPLDISLTVLRDLNIQRPNGIVLGQPLTIYGTLSLMVGGVSLNGNTLSYAPGGSLRYNGLTTQTTSSNEWPVISGPWNIYIMNFNGVQLHADRTIDGDLQVFSGSFLIQSNTLTLNGNLMTFLNGQLIGGTESNLIIGGAFIISPFSLPTITLNNFTLNRSSGIQLTGLLDLYGVMTLTTGLFTVGNNSLILRQPISGSPENLVADFSSTIILGGNSPGLDIGPGETIRLVDIGQLIINNTSSQGVHLKGNLNVWNTLHIYDGSTFFVDAGSQLTVNGTILNEQGANGFILKSFQSSDGRGNNDASLIYSGPDVLATVERYISGQSNAWHQISSPVIDQIINNAEPSDFDNGGFFTWHEPAQTWVSFENSTVWPTWEDVNSGQYTFLPARGYMVSYEENPVKSFNGYLNRGNYFTTLEVKSNETEAYRGFNLVGNPYPSSIDWKAPVGWTRFDLVADINGGYTMWIWNQVAGNYGSFNSSGEEGTNGVTQYIPPMQGFWVQAAMDNGLLGMTDILRVHSSQSWLKSWNASHPAIRVKVRGNTKPYRDELLIESGHDIAGAGSSKMFSLLKEAPSIYIADGGKAYSISFLRDFSEFGSVNIGFRAGYDVTYALQFNLTDMPGLLMLEDRKTGNRQVIYPDSEYGFTAQPDDNPDRFVLYFNTPGNRLEEIEFPEISYCDGVISLSSPWPGATQFELYDMSGRMVESFICPESEKIVKPLGYPTGVYYGRFIQGNKAIGRKVLVY